MTQPASPRGLPFHGMASEDIENFLSWRFVSPHEQIHTNLGRVVCSQQGCCEKDLESASFVQDQQSRHSVVRTHQAREIVKWLGGSPGLIILPAGETPPPGMDYLCELMAGEMSAQECVVWAWATFDDDPWSTPKHPSAGSAGAP